jgi:spermidine synthase
VTSRQLLTRLGLVGLLAWAFWWLPTLSSLRLRGAEYLWFTYPAFGADFYTQTDYAARLWASGGDPYANESYLFHYPPIVIRLFNWVIRLTPHAALVIWVLVIIALIAGGTVLALRTRRELGGSDLPAPFAILLVFLTFPAIFAMERANFDLIVLIAIVVALKIMEPGGKIRDFIGGTVFAVAPWVKLYPGLIGVGLLGLRRFWAVAGFAFGGVAIGLLTPAETLRSFHIIRLAVRNYTAFAEIGHYDWWSHSLTVAWLRATIALSSSPLGPLLSKIPGTVAALLFIAPLLGWVTLRVYRSKHGYRVAYPLLMWICALASCLPVIANDYSLVFLPIAAVAVYGSDSGRLAHWAMLASLLWWQPFRLPIPPPWLLLCKLSALVAVASSLVERVEALDRAAAPEYTGGSPVSRYVSAGVLGAAMERKPFYFEIFTTSLGALLLEISYTRIFSFKVFYYFTYLLLGVGLLGIGAGGILLATSERLRKMPPERLIPIASFAAGASVLVGYTIISPLQINIAQHLTSPSEIGKFVIATLLLTASFFGVGLVVSSILSSRPEAAGRLYGADLLGAALGCTLAIPLISTLTPPRTVMLAGLFLAVGGLRLARPVRSLFWVGIAISAVLAVPAFIWGLLPDPVVAESKQYEGYRKSIWFSQWSPVFRVDVATHPTHPGEVFLNFHDGQPGSGMRFFDGTFGRFKYLDKDARALPFEMAPPEPKVLIIGAAGGHEIVASLYFKASHITGVELNPVTYSLLKTYFADITGHLADNPKVTLLNGDGRWFLRQTENKYDLVWFVAPDSYAAMNASTSGAFVLSESYLYTVEMVKESLRHLTSNGIICTQFGEMFYDKKPNRTTRYLATARAALSEERVSNFEDHVVVASAAGYPPFQESSVLIGKEAFSPAQLEAFARRTKAIGGGVVRYAPNRPADSTAVNQVITLGTPQLRGFFDQYPYQVDPVRDDAPFFWHFARFRDALRTPLPGNGIIDHEDSIAEQITVVFLGVVVLLAFSFLLLPLLVIRKSWKEMPHKAASATYFAALGLGFMFLEVGLIQKLTLLLGYPTYSLSVTLFALLLSSGVGSLLTSRYAGRRNRGLLTVLGALAAVVLSEQALLPTIIDQFVGSMLGVRVVLTVLLILPIGLCLGTFMPIGLRTVGALSARSREYVAWAWAVNCFFSVIASILATIVGMVIGFKGLLLVALGVYVVGVMAMMRVPEQRERA